jgi:hypothetical protein
VHQWVRAYWMCPLMQQAKTDSKTSKMVVFFPSSALSPPQKFGERFFHNQIIIDRVIMNFFYDSLVNNPSESQFVEKNDLFSIHFYRLLAPIY